MRFGNSVSETVLSEDSAWFRSCAAAERGLPSFVYLCCEHVYYLGRSSRYELTVL